MAHGAFGPHHYARGKLNEVARAMATSSGSAQERVYQARSTLLTALRKADFPPPLCDEFEAILATIEPYCGKWGPGGFEKLDLARAGKKMMPRTAEKLLGRIWDLRFDLFEATDEKGFAKP